MNKNADQVYLELLQDILDNGVVKKDRTGTGTISVFGRQVNFNLKAGLPLLTTKKIFTKAIIHELIWFLNGDTNIKYLVDNGVNIWNGDSFKKYTQREIKYSGDRDANGKHWDLEKFVTLIKYDAGFADLYGNLGPVYGAQWRNWNGIDQIAELINKLKNSPDDRRMIVSAWNVSEIDKMTLPPCHNFFQCYTRELSLDERLHWLVNNRYETGFEYQILLDNAQENSDFLDSEYFNVPKRALSLMFNMRSIDTFLGLPFNVSSYAILTHILAARVNMIPDKLIGNLGDTHLYLNHLEQAKEQLTRDPNKYPSPILKVDPSKITGDLKDISYDAFDICNYESYPKIEAALSN